GIFELEGAVLPKSVPPRDSRWVNLKSWNCLRFADYKSELAMMSKQINRRVFLALIACLLSIVVFINGSLVSAKLQRPAVAPSTSRSAAVVAATESVLKETSELRELSVLRDV